MRQKEGVGLTAGFRQCAFRRFIHRGDQRFISSRVWRATNVGVAHQAVRNAFGVDAADTGQRLRGLQARHADAQIARHEFEINQAFLRCQHAPMLAQARLQFLGWLASQRQQLGHPLGQAAHHRFAGQGRQQQRNGLGQVAHGLVAFVKKPFGKA